MAFPIDDPLERSL